MRSRIKKNSNPKSSELTKINRWLELYVFSNQINYNYFLMFKSNHAHKKAIVYKPTPVALVSINTAQHEKQKRGLLNKKN